MKQRSYSAFILFLIGIAAVGPSLIAAPKEPPKPTNEECMALMTGRRIRHLPVVEGATIAGIVSIGDLMRSVITVQGETIQYLQQYINGHYQG